MKTKAPTPVCTSFLIVKKHARDQRTQDDLLVGLPRAFWHRTFPSAAPLSFFIRCTSGHGQYPMEVQLQSLGGDMVWKEGPPQPWPMPDPLETYDYKMNTCVIFPAPGIYQFVLVLDGEEVSRQRFHVIFGEAPRPKPPVP